MGAALATSRLAAARRVAGAVALATAWEAGAAVELWQGRASGCCVAVCRGASLAAALWLCLRWEGAAASAEREAAVRAELAVPLRVAAFAQGAAGGDDWRSPAAAWRDFTDAVGALRFHGVRLRTHCAFASKAILWGNDWQDPLELGADALESNVVQCLPRLLRFCLAVRAGAALDAFVLELRGAAYGADVAAFASTVHRVLAALSAADPAGAECMRSCRLAKRGWYFQFACEPLFVTTFAPCYPASSARYQFGVHPESCFVLFQPEESFFRHDLPPDKPRAATNWEQPADVRDRIRGNFRRAGREYRIPETTNYAPADFIVAPLDALNDPPVRFWLPEPLSTP